MKTSPIISTLVILNLAVLTYILLWKTGRTKNVEQVSRQEQVQEGEQRAVEALPSFRFSSMPKSILLKDAEGETIYQKTEFDNQFLLEEEEAIIIPINQEQKSELQLIVHWQNEAKPYHFFTMEFYGSQSAKFGTATTQDLYEDIILEW